MTTDPDPDDAKIAEIKGQIVVHNRLVLELARAKRFDGMPELQQKLQILRRQLETLNKVANRKGPRKHAR